MENRNLELMRGLIRQFVDEKEKNGFCKLIYEKLYAHLANSFCEAVGEHCKFIIFGREYSLSAQELYNYDRYLALEEWNDHVDHLFNDFRDLVSDVVQDDLDDFTSEFQRWLASQDDERASNAIVALMIGEVDLTEIVVDWLYDYLRSEDWDYPV